MICTVRQLQQILSTVSHLLVPALISLCHVMSHGGTLKSKSNYKLLQGDAANTLGLISNLTLLQNHM